MSADPSLPPASTLADLSAEELEQVLTPLFESTSAVARQLVGRRFEEWTDVVAAASVAIDGLSPDEQVVLLRGHARLGEDPKKLAQISQISLAEQQADVAAALDGALDDVRAELRALGQAYQDHFGFPFIEFVAGRPLAAIVPVIRWRMTRPPDVEREAGLRAIVDIAADRAAKFTATDATAISERQQKGDT